MKTAASRIKEVIFTALITAVCVQGSWNFSLDGDLRYRLSDYRTHDGGVHAVGASVRKTFSDDSGDRLIFFGLAEAEDNFSEVMMHELYLRYKGPLGAWNITAGRFTLPYGLLTTFSTSRLLYEASISQTIGFDADNGVMVSGVAGVMDYALAVTQGYGPHRMPGFPGHGLFTGRFGLTLGEAEEYSIGISALAGRTDGGHHGDMATERLMGGFDATVAYGQAMLRLEGSAGKAGGEFMTTAFAALDYALLPALEVNTAVEGSMHGNQKLDSWFIGLSYRPQWFTLRGGYTYARYNAPEHTISFQLYRLFSFTL